MFALEASRGASEEVRFVVSVSGTVVDARTVLVTGAARMEL